MRKPTEGDNEQPLGPLYILSTQATEISVVLTGTTQGSVDLCRYVVDERKESKINLQTMFEDSNLRRKKLLDHPHP